jgi:hypothetical protein
MPAQSKAQQRFMGMVHAAQKGDMENPSPEVKKAADSMTKKAAKDFASTKHDELPDKKEEIIKALKERIRKVVREMNTTGNVQGYMTPKAFGKPDNEKQKGKRLADLTGYSVVNESNTLDKETIFKIYNVPKGAIKPSAKKERWGYSIKYTHPKTGSLQTGFLSNSTIEKYLKGKVKESIVSNQITENRWLELKNEEASAQAKIGRGISNINKQLKEMERFLNWYGKIKNESGVNNKSYWKRTNNHIYAIKERLLKLDQKIRQISE